MSKENIQLERFLSQGLVAAEGARPHPMTRARGAFEMAAGMSVFLLMATFSRAHSPDRSFNSTPIAGDRNYMTDCDDCPQSKAAKMFDHGRFRFALGMAPAPRT